MKKTTKRILSLVMCLAMLLPFTLQIVPVAAADIMKRKSTCKETPLKHGKSLKLFSGSFHNIFESVLAAKICKYGHKTFVLSPLRQICLNFNLGTFYRFSLRIGICSCIDFCRSNMNMAKEITNVNQVCPCLQHMHCFRMPLWHNRDKSENPCGATGWLVCPNSFSTNFPAKNRHNEGCQKARCVVKDKKNVYYPAGASTSWLGAFYQQGTGR